MDFKNATKIIVSILKDSNRRVFDEISLQNLLGSSRDSWGKYLKGVSRDEIITELVDSEVLARKKLTVKGSKESYVRYLFNSPSPYEVGLGIKKNSYLSHGTAVYLHGLNNQISKTVYVNKEQSKKPPNNNNILNQESINKAFSKSQRSSASKLEFQDYNIVLLNGKNTNKLHVTQIELDGHKLDITNIERTLVDIAVRPDYSGGTTQVLEAYNNALGNVSVNTMHAILKKLNYIYPYHQVIGFYLEKAGFPREKYNIFKNNFSIEFDFYLEYSIPKSSREYSKEWKLFYPKGL